MILSAVTARTGLASLENDDWRGGDEINEKYVWGKTTSVGDKRLAIKKVPLNASRLGFAQSYPRTVDGQPT